MIEELVAHIYLKNDKQLEAVTSAVAAANNNSGGGDGDADADGEAAGGGGRPRGYSSVRSGGVSESDADASEHSDDELSTSFVRRRSSDRRSEAERTEFRNSLTNSK